MSPSVLKPEAPDARAAPSPVVRPAAQAYAALGLLFVVYLLNYLDRTLIFILFSPIKAEMKLSELELALLGSTSFVLFYTVLGVPFGRLADRVVRKRMIAAGLVVWSLFSGLTGLQRGFVGIFLCRMLVGVGEATLGPAALSLLSDLFPRRMRATAGALFSAGIPLGAGAALFVGGLISQRLGWRWAFGLLGFPGLAIAALVMLIREPARGATEEQAPAAAPPAHVPPVLEGLKTILASGLLRRLFVGYAFYAVAANALSIWVPTFLVKSFGLPLAQAGAYAGFCAAVGGLLGAVGGGLGADWFQARGPGGRLTFTSLGALACVPLWLALLHADSVVGVLVPYFFLMALALMWLGPAAADIQDVVGPRLRGLGVGVYFFVVNVIGYGIAPPLTGALSDRLGVGADPSKMRLSLLVCPAASFVAALVLFAASRARARAQGDAPPAPAP